MLGDCFSDLHDIQLCTILLLACFKEGPDCVRRRAEGSSPCESDLYKACLLHQPDLVPDRDRAANSLGPGFRTFCQMGRQFIFNYHVGKLNSPSGLENAEKFPETGWFVGDQIYDTV